MLTRIDRIVLAVSDPAEAARGWTSLLGAVHDRDDTAVGAKRSSYRLGSGRIDFLSPDGAGPVADAVSRRGAHLFCAGVATPELDIVVSRLRSKGLEPVVEGEHAWLWPAAPVVVSRDEQLDSVGAVDFLYEVTDLRHEAQAWASRYADWFGLDGGVFVPISSERWGYAGVLTLFDADRLDRLEVITPNDPARSMGRFFAKQGEGLYMAFAESGDVPAIVERAREADAPHTADDGHTVFLHPQALGGTMLGVSARTRAWQWSGHPERVQDSAR